MGRTITDSFLLEQLKSNKKFKQLFEYIESDDKACLEHRKDNKPVLYYDSKKMFVFEAMKQGGRYIRVSFPKYYFGGKKDDQFELEGVKDWAATIRKYSEIQSNHILNVQETLGYQEDRWQFELVRHFNNLHPGFEDYYVINTEYGQEGDNNRNFVDLVLLHGLNSGNPQIVLCELKYGDGSLCNHGINDHLVQYQGYLNEQDKLKRLVSDLTNVFKQRCFLGLIKGVDSKTYSDLSINYEDTTAMIVVREHNPNSKRLNNELSLVRSNLMISPIKKKTKIIVYNRGKYNPNNPFDERFCLDDFC